MQANFASALAGVLRHEGGYVNHPNDPGGPTNRGITLATFRKWVKRDGTAEDLKRITEDQVAKIYRSGYWNAIKGDDLPSGLDYAVFDFAVNSGPGRAAKALQAVLGVTQDGIIGPVTLAAAQQADVASAINALSDGRMAFLRRLKTWPTFGRGWTRRVSEVRQKALSMVYAEPPSPQPAPVPQPKPQPAPIPISPPSKPSNGMGFLGWGIFIVVALSALAYALVGIKF